MPNIKSAKKRMIQGEARRQRNMARKSALKTAVRKVRDAVASKDVAAAQTFLKDAEAQISRAAGKGVLHRSTARRKISRLAHFVALAARGSVSAKK